MRPGEVEVLGRLTPLHIPVSGHMLHPVVASMPARPDFRLAAAEVERLLEVPLASCARPEAVRAGMMRERPPSVLMDVPYFALDGAKVWGATAMILAEFLAVLEGLDVGGLTNPLACRPPSPLGAAVLREAVSGCRSGVRPTQSGKRQRGRVSAEARGPAARAARRRAPATRRVAG